MAPISIGDNYYGTDNTTATGDFWPEETTWSDNVTPYYVHEVRAEPEPGPSEFDRQLMLEEERVRWREQIFDSSMPRVLVQGSRGWKSVSQTFLISPERVVSQRYGWQ